MSEKPANCENAFALLQGKGGVGMADVVKAKIGHVRFDADPLPEASEPIGASVLLGSSRRKDPDAVSDQVIEDFASGVGQPNSPRSSLAVSQEQMALTVVRSAKSEYFALSASREQKKTNGGDFQRPLALMRRQPRRNSGDFVIRKIPFAPFSPVPAHASAGIGPLGPIPHEFGLFEYGR